MFPHLTKYLSQYKQVIIPGIGSFELVHQPATLDVADKLIYPPAYTTKYTLSDTVKEHQLNYLSEDLQKDQVTIQEQLQSFGKEVATQLQQKPVYWKGIGRLESSGSKILFYPDVISIEGLQPVPARKVMRENVQHTVLVGEKEVRSGQRTELFPPILKKKKFSVLLGGAIVLVLAVLFILFILFREGFHPSSVGTKMKIKAVAPAPTYK